MPLRPPPALASVAQAANSETAPLRGADASGTAVDTSDPRLYAPAAARNQSALIEVLKAHAPAKGRALEIASGTGEHVVAFATALPGLHWQPSEIDPARRASIDAHGKAAAPANLARAIALDATAQGWANSLRGQWDLVFVANLLHLISAAECALLLQGLAQALAPGGRAMIYGPFLRDGETTSPGDARFDAALRAHDPDIGYKDHDEIAALLREAGLRRDAVIDMPANNLCLRFSTR